MASETYVITIRFAWWFRPAVKCGVLWARFRGVPSTYEAVAVWLKSLVNSGLVLR